MPAFNCAAHPVGSVFKTSSRFPSAQHLRSPPGPDRHLALGGWPELPALTPSSLSSLCEPLQTWHPPFFLSHNPHIAPMSLEKSSRSVIGRHPHPAPKPGLLLIFPRLCISHTISWSLSDMLCTYRKAWCPCCSLCLRCSSYPDRQRDSSLRSSSPP